MAPCCQRPDTGPALLSLPIGLMLLFWAELSGNMVGGCALLFEVLLNGTRALIDFLLLCDPSPERTLQQQVLSPPGMPEPVCWPVHLIVSVCTPGLGRYFGTLSDLPLGLSLESLESSPPPCTIQG